MTGVFHTDNEQQTQALGAEFARELISGDVVALSGELGAGKTAFTRGLAHALGFEGEVTSPTFTIMNLYPSTPPVAHFDVYRISADELFNTGFFDYAGADCVTVVEWSELIDDYIEDGAYSVVIKYADDGGRDVTISKRGEKPC